LDRLVHVRFDVRHDHDHSDPGSRSGIPGYDDGDRHVDRRSRREPREWQRRRRRFAF
jgi:hypothetical protein